MSTYYAHLSLLSLLVLLMVSQCSGTRWQSSYRYLLADFDRCHQGVDVVMWVQGRADNPARRAIIRELLANRKAWPKHVRVVTFFMVGTTRNSRLQARLRYEFESYRDIVQNDYIENYKNQTAKMISAINFLADYCSNSKLAIRIDDDVLFHPSTMINKVVALMTQNASNTYNETEDYHDHREFVNSLNNSTITQIFETDGLDHRIADEPDGSGSKLTNKNTILCHILAKRKIIRTWMRLEYPVNNTVLSNETIYPDFCAGFFIAISSDLLPKFRILFEFEPPFWIDDSYLGVLQRRLKTINVSASSMLHFDVPRLPLRDLITGRTVKKAIAVHLMQGKKYYGHLKRSKALDVFNHDLR